MDSVIGIRPLITGIGTAPGLNQFPGRIKLQHGGSRGTAFSGFEIQGQFIGVQGGGATVNNPHMVLIVDPYPDGHAQQPMVR